MNALPRHLRLACEAMARGDYDEVHSSHVREIFALDGWRLISTTIEDDISDYDTWYRAECGRSAFPMGTIIHA